MSAIVVSRLYAKLKAKPLVTGIVLILLAVGVARLADKLVKVCGVQRLVEANHDYLQNSFEKSGASFLVLSGIKGGVAILEGSTIGGEAVVTTDIQVGDAVQPIYDLIDVAWRITFASGAVLLLTMLLLDTIFQWGPTFLTLAFVSGAVLWLAANGFPKMRWCGVLLRRACSFFVVCVMGIYLVLPLATGAARYLSKTISAPMIDAGVAELKQLEEDSSPAAIQDRFFPDGEKTKEKLNIKKKAVEILTWCKETTKRVITRGIRLCAGFLFDCFLFPFVIVIVGYTLVKRGLSVFGLTSQHSLREDFRWLGDKYLKKADELDRQ